MAYLLQQLSSESAMRRPDGVAVSARGQSLTYAQLEAMSNRLAHLFRDRGVKRGDRVGLFFPKSVQSVACMLGALKAGAMYVPIDPQAPPARVAYITRNCEINCLVTTKAGASALEVGGVKDMRTRLLTDASVSETSAHSGLVPWEALDAFADTSPAAMGVETDLAYILYTSGSTGVPKGVMISHRNALTFVDWCATAFAVRPNDRLSNHAPLHFDLSVFDIYNALLAGATVHMVDSDTAVFPASMARFIETHRITVWYSVPSALVGLVLHGGLSRRKLDALRLVLFAGEIFPMKYLRQLADLLPHVALYNLYGPTETNVCTYHRVDSQTLPFAEHLPIGLACANTDVFAVNERDEPIKPGEVGELYVRGPSVTPGYWGDPEKTSRAVVPNRFQPHVAERVYRTGDIVTVDADGVYWFQGRRDSMIKSRGYRIELGDIEAAVYDHPAVLEAAVIPIPDEEIGNRIKVFVVRHPGAQVSSSELQSHCTARIPRYMIPEIVEFCALLPKTSTGKIDRTVLANSWIRKEEP
jgi:amino acid adenylation domain-containing protein